MNGGVSFNDIMTPNKIATLMSANLRICANVYVIIWDLHMNKKCV